MKGGIYDHSFNYRIPAYQGSIKSNGELQMKLEFLVKQQHIVRVDNQKVVARSKNYLKAHFMFSDEWKGIKTAIFKNGENVYNQIIDENNGVCLVPWEVIKAGVLQVSVFCGELITADKAAVEITCSGYEEGKTPQEPTPGVYEQILSRLEISVLKELFAGNGMIGYVAKERVDGKLVLPEAVQILKIKAKFGT